MRCQSYRQEALRIIQGLHDAGSKDRHSLFTPQHDLFSLDAGALTARRKPIRHPASPHRRRLSAASHTSVRRVPLSVNALSCACNVAHSVHALAAVHARCNATTVRPPQSPGRCQCDKTSCAGSMLAVDRLQPDTRASARQPVTNGRVQLPMRRPRTKNTTLPQR